MNVDSFLQRLKVSLDAVTVHEEKLKTIAEEIAGFFSLHSHEVGLFSVNRKKHEISFLWPQGMANAGHIPLNAINSLVAKTANELVPIVDNSFATSRHLYIFEFMLAEKSDRIPIQKIMSVPVIADGVSIAVIQVVHKAASLAEAGEDFTAQNLEDLVQIASFFSGYNLQSFL